MENLSNINIVIHHYPCPDGELSASIFKSKYKNSIFIPWMHENKEKLVKEIKEIISNQHTKPIVYYLDYCPDFLTALETVLFLCNGLANHPVCFFVFVFFMVSTCVCL